MVLPLPVELPSDVTTLADLGDDRDRDMRVQPGSTECRLRIEAAAGMRLAGLSSGIEVPEGPILLKVDFIRDDEESQTHVAVSVLSVVP